MSDETNQKPRFTADFYKGCPCIRDNKKPRVALIGDAGYVIMCLEEIQLNGLDPEHLSWCDTEPTQPELNYAENPS